MYDFTAIFTPPDADILTRIFLSLALGAVIGLEREITNKSAGLRTNILVCVGSCLFTILSIFGFSNAISVYPMGDPARVAAQILTGIGFIGGGTVLRHGTSVYGLTTAATLWMTASVGMACGCGKYNIAILCAIVSVAVLSLIRIFEKHCIPKTQKNNRDIKVSLTCTEDDYPDFVDTIPKMFPDLYEMNKKDSSGEFNQVKISFRIRMCCKNPIENIYEKFKNNKKIIVISVKELNE